MKQINVYDFDGTIFEGDCSVQFYLFCLRHRPFIATCILKQLKGTISYFFGYGTKLAWKESFFSFLNKVDDIDDLVEMFWSSNEHKIASWYLKQKKETDLIISASPEFILIPICQQLGIQKPIASKVDKRTGKFFSANCYGIEKVKRLQQEYSDTVIDNFYTDSRSDFPMLQLTSHFFMVKAGKIVKIK